MTYKLLKPTVAVALLSVSIAPLHGCSEASQNATDSGSGGGLSSVSSSSATTSSATSASTGGGNGDPTWQPLRDALDASQLDDMAVIVGDKRGRLFEYNKGGATFDATYRSASAIKWVSSAVILRLAEAGVLSLDDHPQAYLNWWTNDPADMRSQVTIRQLLAFTSGFRGDVFGAQSPACISDGDTTIAACAQEIYAAEFVDQPGSGFFYGPAHLQLLAALAEAATGSSWAAVFQKHLAAPLGMTSTVYRYPSVNNPRISGGADTNANDMAAFLEAMLSRTLFPTTWDAMAADATPSSQVTLLSSPLESSNYEWHFGLGVWRECLNPSWLPACDPLDILSITGAFGVHGWVDTNNEFYGLVMTDQGFGGSAVSLELALEIRPLVLTALGK